MKHLTITDTKKHFTFQQPSKWNCHFCAFKEDDKLCNVLGKNSIIHIYV